MKCPYCEANVPDNVRYCRNCGKMVGNTGTTTGGNTNAIRSLTPGARLQGGRYVVKQILGQGGMGAALLATDIRLDNKQVVIKELLSESEEPQRKAEDVRNFKREVATLAHIDHPLVPNVTDHFEEGTRYFMVQEYVEGETLEQRLESLQQPMRERDILVCAIELLDVLEYLSQQMPPLIHRDIKPANVIIGAKDKRAHLVDFGIARADEAKNAQKKQTSALGTPGYAPPEQYQGNADPRSDLYGLAATLHHIATNRDPREHPPFHFPAVCSLNPQLSPEFEKILIRALNNDRGQRYQSATAFKQDIEGVLRSRYGISGGLDHYTLGTSGAMGSIQPTVVQGQTQVQPTVVQGQTQVQPTVAQTQVQPTVVQAPITPVYGLTSSSSMPTVVSAPQFGNTGPSQSFGPNTGPTQNPYQPVQNPYQTGNSMYGVNPPPPPRQPKKRRTGLIVLIVLLLFLLIGGGTFAAVYGRQFFGSQETSGIGVTQVGNEILGISDGSHAFDTTLPNGALKTQAAQALQKNPNDSNTATSLLNEAIAKTSNDAEALIYLENLRVINSGSPYVTVVVATMLTGEKGQVSVGRDNLQGAYVAQKELNDSARLPNGTLVRVLIANSGSKGENVNTVAQQIVRLAQSDRTFVGVMGWPYSDRSLEGIKVLGQAHIPMVSQTASSDLLTRISPYFFRVVPPNEDQGKAGANYAINKMNAKKAALFYDPTNTYSQSLAQAFKRYYEQAGATITIEKQYKVGKPASIPEVLPDALNTKPDMIYFAGYAADINTLLTNLPAGNLPVMGGDALYELGGYQSSSRANFSRLRFTTFAYPDEWAVLGQEKNKPAFFTQYIAAFDPNKQHPGYGFTRANNNVILSYDAMVTLLSGCGNALRSGKQTITPEDVKLGLAAIDAKNALQGVSGRIAFKANGDPEDKVVVILYVDENGYIHMDNTISGRFLK